jgi:hypothetical protein
MFVPLQTCASRSYGVSKPNGCFQIFQYIKPRRCFISLLARNSNPLTKLPNHMCIHRRIFWFFSRVRIFVLYMSLPPVEVWRHFTEGERRDLMCIGDESVKRWLLFYFHFWKRDALSCKRWGPPDRFDWIGENIALIRIGLQPLDIYFRHFLPLLQCLPYINFMTWHKMVTRCTEMEETAREQLKILFYCLMGT